MRGEVSVEGGRTRATGDVGKPVIYSYGGRKISSANTTIRGTRACTVLASLVAALVATADVGAVVKRGQIGGEPCHEPCGRRVRGAIVRIRFLVTGLQGVAGGRKAHGLRVARDVGIAVTI